MPEPALRDDGPMSRKTFRKKLKSEGPGLHFGALWGSVGPAGEALGDLVDAFGFTRQCAGSVFSDFHGKMRFVDFDAILERNCCLCRSGRPSWSLWRPKVALEQPKVDPGAQVGAARTVKLALSARSCCERYGNHRKPGRTQVKQSSKSI